MMVESFAHSVWRHVGLILAHMLDVQKCIMKLLSGTATGLSKPIFGQVPHVIIYIIPGNPIALIFAK